jgi:hypothetical protein
MRWLDQREPVAVCRYMLRGLFVVGLYLPLWAEAQVSDPVPPATNLVAVSGAPAPTEENFTIAAAQDLTVTFTDFKIPAPLTTATIVVTQGSTLVGTATMSAPAFTASLALPGAVGAYTLRVIGTPNSTSGVGTFNVCVAPTSSPSACIQSASIAGNITEQSTPANPTVSTNAVTVTVNTAGTYTFTYADDQFPAPLAAGTFSLALFQGSQPVTGAVPLPASPAALPNLPAGVYTLFIVAQADPTAKAGLYSVTVTGPAGIAPLSSATYPVGQMQPGTTVKNPGAESLTLMVTDFAFPTALASASALVTAGGSSLGMASAGAGAATLTTAPAGAALQVWSYGAAGTAAGTYEVDLASATASVLQSAAGVNVTGSYAYAFVSSNPLAAGSYRATASDFQFPAPLSSLAFAVAQNHAILKQSSAAGSVSFTAAAGPVVLLAAAAPASGANGLFDINVQNSSSAVAFDQIQTVSPVGGFISQPITLGTSGNYNVTLSDQKTPAAFSTLALVGSSAGNVLGKIFGGGTFPITASPGDYQLTVVAIPASSQQYGLYGLSVVNAPPTITLSASPASVTAGGAATLTWTTTSATACTGSGGTFTGSQATGSGSIAVSVAATTTYTLSCTGPGGSASKSVTVMATAAVTSSGGGGSLDPAAIAALALLFIVRAARSKRSAIARDCHPSTSGYADSPAEG